MRNKMLFCALSLAAAGALQTQAAWTDDSGTKINDQTIVCDYGSYRGARYLIVNDSEVDLAFYCLAPDVEHVPNYDDTGEFIGFSHYYHGFPPVTLPDTLLCEGKHYAMRAIKSGCFADDDYGLSWSDALIDGYGRLKIVELPFKTLEHNMFAAPIHGIEEMYLPNVEVIEANVGLSPLWAQYVRIGTNVREIGSNLFSNSNIVMDAEQPFQVADDAFEDCSIFVRNSAVERFKQQWPQYRDNIQGVLDVEVTPTSVTLSPREVMMSMSVPDEDYTPDHGDTGGITYVDARQMVVTIAAEDEKHEGLTPGTTYHFPVRVLSHDNENYGTVAYVDTITVRTPAAGVSLAIDSWQLASTSITATFTLGCEAVVDSARVSVNGRDWPCTVTTADGVTRFTACADGLQPGAIYELTAHCVAAGQEHTTTVTLPTLCEQQASSGDVTGDGVTDIDDVNRIINIMLHKE